MSRRTAISLSIVTILLLSILPISPALANQSGGVLSTFSGGLPTADINLNGNVTNSSFGIDIPRNSTFVSAQFSVEIQSTDISPGQVWIDHAQDGQYEWAFAGVGYGDIGHQNEFVSGFSTDSVSVNSNSSRSTEFYMPFNASVAESAVEISFSPQLHSNFLPINSVIDVISSDIDGDGTDEAVILVDDYAVTGFNNSAWSVLDWTQNNGFAFSNWTSTCTNVTKLESADFNNDSKDDILGVAISEDLACLHLSNQTGFAVQANYSTANGLIALKIGDFTRDGTPDLVSVHSNGVFSVFPWVNSTSSFKSMTNKSIYRNNSNNLVALTDLTIGEFSSLHNDTTTVVSTWRAEGIELFWNRGVIVENLFRFTGLRSNFIEADFDGDGDIDFASRSNSGHNMIWNNGSTWGRVGSQDLFSWDNVTVGDHDLDGVYSMFLPTPGTADGNSSTINGSISIRDLTSSGVGFEKLTTLTPESIPRKITFVDFNGDGLDEHVVMSGESTQGLFIGAYHMASIDLENDGNPELITEGYSGNGTTYSELYVNDTTGNISTALTNYILAKSPWQDAYGNEFVTMNFTATGRGLGDVVINILDIGYDCTFNANVNPSPTGNLSNLFNQQMTLGSGDFLLPLPVNSTKAGEITFTDLVAPYVAGAPNIAVPLTPTLQLEQVSSDSVMLSWDDPFLFGLDLMGFEVFKTINGSSFDYDNPYDTPSFNMSVDPEVMPGLTYDYRVRSTHQYGVTSNLSNVLTVSIPYPGPPGDIENLSVNDVQNDGGGQLLASWNMGSELVQSYEIYVLNFDFNSTDNVSSSLDISQRSQVSIMLNQTSEYTNEQGQVISSQPIENGVPYYVAIVGLNEYGNKSSEVASIGPVYARNDTVRIPQISLDISGVIEQSQGEFTLRPSGEFSISMTVTVDSMAYAGAPVYINLNHSEFEQNFTGTTDENGSYMAISLDNLSNIISDGVVIGELELEYGVLGVLNNPQIQPVSGLSQVEIINSTLSAEISYPSDIEIDSSGIFELNFQIDSPFAESVDFSGVTFDYLVYDSDATILGSGQTDSDQDGMFNLIGQQPSASYLEFEISSIPEYMEISTSMFRVNLTSEPIETNNTETNETENQTQEGNNTIEPVDETPDSINGVTIDGCPGIVANEGEQFMSQLQCTLINSNDFDVRVGITFIPTSQFTATTSMNDVFIRAGESKAVFWNLNVEVDSLVSEQGAMSVELTTASDEYPQLSTTETSSIDFEIIAQEEEVGPQDDGSSSAVLVIGGVGGLVAIIALVSVLVLRGRGSDEEEDTDWMEEMPDRQIEPSEGLPVGMGLDELKSRGKEIPEFEPEARERLGGNLIGELGHEEEQVTEASEESDDGISVDEYGTEWYEDETGVWWYREAGQEEWSEFES